MCFATSRPEIVLYFVVFFVYHWLKFIFLSLVLFRTLYLVAWLAKFFGSFFDSFRSAIRFQLPPFISFVLAISFSAGPAVLVMLQVKALRSRFPNLNIEVDGGVDETTISEVATAGANVVVSGSGIFKSQDRARTIGVLRKCVQDALSRV